MINAGAKRAKLLGFFFFNMQIYDVLVLTDKESTRVPPTSPRLGFGLDA